MEDLYGTYEAGLLLSSLTPDWSVTISHCCSYRHCVLLAHIYLYHVLQLIGNLFLAQTEKLLEPLVRIEMPLARVLAEVETTGIAASPKLLADQK